MKKITLLILSILLINLSLPLPIAAKIIVEPENSIPSDNINNYYLSDSFIFKENSQYAFFYGYKITTGTTPIVSDGKLLLPLEYITNVFGGSIRSSIFNTALTYINNHRLLIFLYNGKTLLDGIEIREKSKQIHGATYIPVEVAAKLLDGYLYYQNGIAIISGNKNLFDKIDRNVVFESLSQAFVKHNYKTFKDFLTGLVPDVFISSNAAVSNFADKTEISTIFKQAVSFYKWQMYEDSIKQLDRILAVDKNLVDALNLKALCLELLGNYDEALIYYNNAIAAAPYFPLYHRNAGNLLLSMERFDEAIELFSKALQFNTNDISANIGTGNAYFYNFQYEYAIEYYKNAIESGCRDSQVFYNICLSSVYTGNPQSALLYIDRAISADPLYTQYYVLKGTVLNLLERYEEAAVLLTEASKAMTDNNELYNELGLSLFFLEQYDEAEKYFEKALTIEPYDISTITYLTDCRIQMENFEQALETIEFAITIKPGSADLHMRKGLILYELGMFSDAVLSSDNALKLNPEITAALYIKGLASYSVEAYYDALSCFDEVLKAVPDFASAYYEKAKTSCKLERNKEAEACLAKALELEPGLYENAVKDNAFIVLQNSAGFVEIINKAKKALNLQ